MGRYTSIQTVTFARSYSFRGLDVANVIRKSKYEGWNFNSGNYLFTTDTK